MPKLSNPSKRQLRDILDRRTSAFVRAQGKCEADSHISQCNDTLTNSHIISRSYIKVQFDPRNIQCVCGTEHMILEKNPIMFARFVESTSCGKYVDTMIIQANASPKPDYDLWVRIWDITELRRYTLEQAREWLGQNIILNEFDLLKLQ